MLNLQNLVITHHAREALEARPAPDLAETLTRPVVIEPHEGKRRFVGRLGLVAVVAGTDERPILVTILLRRRGAWTDEDAQRRAKE